MKKTIIILLFIPLISLSQENIKYAETITIEDIKKHINILASDSLEGRETGKEGQKKAAKYIANYFKNIGIPPPSKLPKEIKEIKDFLSRTLSLEKKTKKEKKDIEKYYQKFTVKTRKHNFYATYFSFKM